MFMRMICLAPYLSGAADYAPNCIFIQFGAYLIPVKLVIWMGRRREDLKAFPTEARREIGYQLEHVQEGVDPDD
jgi:hypothetical protein